MPRPELSLLPSLSFRNAMQTPPGVVLRLSRLSYFSRLEWPMTVLSSARHLHYAGCQGSLRGQGDTSFPQPGHTFQSSKVFSFLLLPWRRPKSRHYRSFPVLMALRCAEPDLDSICRFLTRYRYKVPAVADVDVAPRHAVIRIAQPVRKRPYIGSPTQAEVGDS